MIGKAIPLLFRTRNFTMSAGELVGTYNPRIDTILLLPTALIPDLRSALEMHEGMGHRGFAVQGSFLRVERYYAGQIYAYIATLLQLLSDTRLEMMGKTFADLRFTGKVSGTVPSDVGYWFDIYVNTPQDSLDIITNRLQIFDNVVTTIEDNIRVVYEIIATAWAVRSLHRSLPDNRAKSLEEEMLRDQEKALAKYPGAERFRELYQAYQAIVPVQARHLLGLHALDVWDWHGEDGLLSVNMPDHVERFANLLTIGAYSGVSFQEREEYIREARRRDFTLCQRWSVQQFFHGHLRHLDYECQFPWRLMTLFDSLLFDSISRAHECTGDFDTCLEVMNDSLLKFVFREDQVDAGINDYLRDVIWSPDVNRYIHGLTDEREAELSSGVTADNPLGLTQDWYKWLLLFETLYQALVSGEGAACPLSVSPTASCSKDCPIRRHLSRLAEQSDLVTGPLCPLMD